MISINLLPWRNAARTQALKKFYVQLLGVFIFSTLMIGLLSARLSKESHGLQIQMTALHEQLAAQAPLLKQTTTLLGKKTKLINRLKKSIALQSQDQWLLTNLADLSKQIVPGITIKKIHVQNNIMTLEGKATSPATLLKITTALKNESGTTLADISGLKFTIEKTRP